MVEYEEMLPFTGIGPSEYSDGLAKEVKTGLILLLIDQIGLATWPRPHKHGMVSIPG